MASTWRQKGFDGGNTSYNPEAIGVPDGLRKKYSLDKYYTDSRLHVLVTEDEYICALDGSKDSLVRGYDRGTGDLNWKWRGRGRYLGRQDELIYAVVKDELILDQDGSFHAIERSRDRYEWHRSSENDTLDTLHAGLRLDDESVFAGTWDGVDSNTGNIYELDIEKKRVEHLASTGAVNDILVVDTAVIYQVLDTSPIGTFVNVIERQQGSESPHLLLSEMDYRAITLLLSGNDRVYIYRRNDDGEKFLESHRYEERTDSLDWSRKLNLDIEWEEGTRESVSSVLIRDILYVADSNRLLALNSHTGEKLWSRTRKGSDDQPTNMVATLECLCVSGDEPVGLDPDTGEVLWRHGEPLRFKAVIDDEVVARNPEKNTAHVFRNNATKVYQD